MCWLPVAGGNQTQARQQSLPMLFLDVQPVDLTFSHVADILQPCMIQGNILSGSSWLLPDDITNPPAGSERLRHLAFHEAHSRVMGGDS